MRSAPSSFQSAVTPAPSEDAQYDARWGYRSFDARRYEARRYGGIVRRLREFVG